MVEEEIWKDVVGFEGLYMVSNLGRVKSLNYNHTGQERILRANGKRYLMVVLSKNKKKYPLLVHRIVATAFAPNPQNKKTVNHIDGNKLNNNDWNLEWNTQSENHKAAFKLGLMSQTGEKCSTHKLKEFQVLEIRELIGKKTQEEIAIMYGVKRATISCIKLRKLWNHI